MKQKMYLKLVAMGLLLVVSMVAVVSASYAWFSLSESPAVSGIQVSLSGGSTILIAPDMTVTADGVTYHYPGAFSDTLNFAQHSSYDYLRGLGALSPVSTADGLHWFLATYFDKDDELVKAGLASEGDLRPVQQFQLDNLLGYANQIADTETISTGHYVYLDFWVVSPGSNYKLRIANSDDGGSFVIDLLDPISGAETITGYTLQNPGISSTSTSVRVGFLTSTEIAPDYAMVHYQTTAGYNNSYTALRGVYAEKGSAVADPEQYRFTIYEPNADAHPGTGAEDGTYVATYPLAYFNGVANPTKVIDRSAIQLTNWWRQAENSSDLLLEQVFQTALYGKSDYEAAASGFYTEYLQGQFASYLNKGSFISYSGSLDDHISAEFLQTLEKGNATEDVYIISLERNVPQRIRMFIWIEGQDADWDPSIAASSFAVNLVLAGSNQ